MDGCHGVLEERNEKWSRSFTWERVVRGARENGFLSAGLLEGPFVNLPSHTHTEDYWAKEWFCLFLKVYSQHSPIWRGPLDMLSTAQRPGPGFNLYPCSLSFRIAANEGRSSCQLALIKGRWGRGTECLDRSLHQALGRPFSNRKRSDEEMMLWLGFSSKMVLSRGWQEGSLGSVFPIAYSNQ